MSIAFLPPSPFSRRAMLAGTTVAAAAVVNGSASQARSPWSRWALLFSAISTSVLPALANSASAQAPRAITEMNAPGPERSALATRAGTWDVVATSRAGPDAKPQIMRGLVAERVMIGPFLQETLRPAASARGEAFTRIDYLGYDRVEGRWNYMSLDTSVPVGLMPAWSFDAGAPDRIEMVFEPLAFVGFGDHVTGQMLRSDMTIIRLGPDREVKEQRFISADGRGRPYVGSRYEYTRRP